ncbi:MAG: hypothetical protein ACOX8W_09830 [bacterium]|jgi:hypothetical protein
MVWETDNQKTRSAPPPNGSCRQQPGVLLRVTVPAGAVVKMADNAEMSAPGGINLLLRLPSLGDSSAFSPLIAAIRQVGGTIETVGG